MCPDSEEENNLCCVLCPDLNINDMKAKLNLSVYIMHQSGCNVIFDQVSLRNNIHTINLANRETHIYTP